MADHLLAGPTRRRGRPVGAKTRLLDEHAVIGRHHFSFLRAALEGVSLRRAWESYLSFAGGPDDERHFARRLRELQAQLHRIAEARGLADVAAIAFAAEASAGPIGDDPAAALPSLDGWIAERCAEAELDADALSQAEWLAEYREAFGLDREPLPRPALATPETPATRFTLADRLKALNTLADRVARSPALSDPVETWLGAGIPGHLRMVGVVTLREVIDFVNVHGFRWHRRVAGIGEERAGRIVDWLAPLGVQAGHPFRDYARRRPALALLEREHTLARLAPAPRYAIAPLDRFAVPAELNGAAGTFRVNGPNVLGAKNDVDAILGWLQRYRKSARTFASYSLAVERFYLWCIMERRVALSSLVEGDLLAYSDFLSAPPAHWVQERSVARSDSAWRPFRGPLSPLSQRHNFSVIASLLSDLVEAGYLTANAARGVTPGLKLPRATINKRRSFNEEQWALIMEVLAALPANAFTRRNRLILELGSTTGLRLIEIATARMSGLREVTVDGAKSWMLDVVGKGGKIRSVMVYEDIKDLINAHHADMEAAGIGFDPGVADVRALYGTSSQTTLPSPAGASLASRLTAGAGPDLRPLVGALRKPPPRWSLDDNGVALLPKGPGHAPQNADRYGALDPSALYQSLKRLFRRVADVAAQREAQAGPATDTSIQPSGFLRASTHWLRHFFANSAAQDMDIRLLRDVMGHADLRTTSVYIDVEERELVRGLRGLPRRAGSKSS